MKKLFYAVLLLVVSHVLMAPSACAQKVTKMETKTSSTAITKDAAEYSFKIYKYEDMTYAAFTTSGTRITPNVKNMPFYCGGGVFKVKEDEIYVGYNLEGKLVFPASLMCTQIFHAGNEIFKLEKQQGGENIYAVYNADGQCIIPFSKQYNALFIYPQYSCIWVSDVNGNNYTYSIDGAEYAEGRLYLNTEKGIAEFNRTRINPNSYVAEQKQSVEKGENAPSVIKKSVVKREKHKTPSYTYSNYNRSGWNTEELRFPHHYSEFIGSYHDGQFFVGANYTYIPKRWGFYGAFMYGLDGAYYANVGPTIRLTNSNSTSVDIHLFQGIGLCSGNIEGETGIRFGFGRDKEYGMWSVSGSFCYSPEGLGWTAGLSWPITGIAAGSVLVAGYAILVAYSGSSVSPYKPTYNNSAYNYGDGGDAAIANANRIMQQTDARMQYEMATMPQQIMQQTAQQMAAQEAAKEAQWRQQYENYKKNPGYMLNDDGSLLTWEQFKQRMREIEAQAYMETQQRGNSSNQESGIGGGTQDKHWQNRTTESDCPHCDIPGNGVCKTCGGDGLMDGYGLNPNSLKCSSCGETGQIGKCRFCHGTGKKTSTKTVYE